MQKRLALVTIAFLSFSARAGIKTQAVAYKEGDTALEGFLIYDDSLKGTQPGIVVVHDWMGMGAIPKAKGEALAKLGYVAFVADIYGKGKIPKDAKEAGALAGSFKADRPLLRKRVRAAYDQLLSSKRVDASKTAAIGFCFGGTTVLELARSGAPLASVVSFHGGLETPTPADAKNIKAHLLVLHGADDPFVPAAEVAGFEKEMNDAKVDWQLIKYSGAVHSFSIPNAGNDNSKGAAYNEKADHRSWQAMRDFFKETLGK